MTTIFRSARTGRWVSRLLAKLHPATTVSESASSGPVFVVDDARSCPFCGKQLKAASVVCEFCGSELAK